MPNESSIWPPSRFIKAAEMYTNEFEAILAQVEAPDQVNFFMSTTKQCISFYIFSNIRYHLRRLLDFPPSGFTVPSDDHPIQVDYSQCRARTYEVVAMMCPPENEKVRPSNEPMLWETSISYVFNLALSYIHSYFAFSERLKAVFDVQNAFLSSMNGTPMLFAISQASRDILDKQSGDLFDDDISEIVADINFAHVALAAFGGAQFVLDLFNWPGVKSAIDEAGGFAPVEKMARLLQTHCLTDESDDSAHFELLVDLDELLRRLYAEMNEIKSAADSAQLFLQDMWVHLKKAGSRKNSRSERELMTKQELLRIASSAQIGRAHV